MEKKIIKKTGNTIVDSIGAMEFIGDLIPNMWYKTIISDSGKTNLPAVILLARLLYWYRPKEVKKNDDIYYEKRFIDDRFVQMNYDQIQKELNLTKDQARKAIVYLENKGVVKRHLKTVHTNLGTMSNVMYLELIPSALEGLTFPDEVDDHDKKEKVNRDNIDTSLEKNEQLSPNNRKAVGNDMSTYTEITTENTTERNTTTYKKVVEILSNYNLKESEIKSIYNEANGDVEKVRNAVSALDNYRTPVKNIGGFLISAIKKGYKLNSTNGCKNDYASFNQRHYDYNKLQQEAIKKNNPDRNG